MRLGIRITQGASTEILKSFGETFGGWADIEKAMTHKYIRRIPKKSGQGWYYMYAETFKKPLMALKQIFGFTEERIEIDYEKNNIAKQYGADKRTFASHVLEYFSNKLKWDSLFSKKENREKYKKPIHQKEITTESAKVHNDSPKEIGKTQDVLMVNRSLMKKVWEVYNPAVAKEAEKEDSTVDGIASTETEDPSARSRAMLGNDNAKKDLMAVSSTLKTGKSYFATNKKLGEIEISCGNKSVGLTHIILRRFEEMAKRKENPVNNKNEITSRLTVMMPLLVDAIKTGVVEKQTRPNTWIARKNGLSAIIKKDKGKFLLTGFVDNEKKQEATDAISAGIATYGYTPEFLDLYAQVGAVIAPLITTIPQNDEKSTVITSGTTQIDKEEKNHEENHTGAGSGELPAGIEAVRSGGGEGTGSKDVTSAKAVADEIKRRGDIDEHGSRAGRNIRQRGGRRTIKEIREKVKELLTSKTASQMTVEDKELLKQYEGAGGLHEKEASTHGILYEFYTPQKVINKIWQLVDKYNPNIQKTVIEPSAGTGRFAEGRKEAFDMFELDETSAQIAGILYPEARITRGEFQKLFMNGNSPKKTYDGKKYDVAVGNPPYGSYSGLYKGMGEGKEHTRIEEYFIDRTLDTLKDGGILAMVVPSSFLKGNKTKGKELIAGKAMLLEAWRLPNGIFGTTEVGTDIIVLRKEKGKIQDFTHNIYFADNQDKILGVERERTGKFGYEQYVSPPDGMGFDEALDLLDPLRAEYVPAGEKTAIQKATDEIKIIDPEARSRAMLGNDNARGRVTKTDDRYLFSSGKNMTAAEFNERYSFTVDEKDIPIWRVTCYDGVIDQSLLKTKDIERMKESENFTYDGEGNWYSSVNYASGNIYKKLDELERDKERLGNQYEINKSLLENAKPQPKKVENFTVSPISAFAQEYVIQDGESELSLIESFYKWAGVEINWRKMRYINWGKSPISQYEIPNGITFDDVLGYINQDILKTDRATARESDKATAQMERQDKIKKRREAGERLFNRFLREGLNETDKKTLEESWNRRLNAVKRPDYSKIPVTIEGMNTHKGNKEFTLLEQQVKGISFLCNKGNGILAHEVGVGKTVELICATVNQLSTGRAKRPLICVPKAVYKKWLGEIKQHFPDIQVNELGNFSDNDLKGLRTTEGGLRIPEGTVSVCTYEALQKITFKPETVDFELFSDLIDSQIVSTELGGEKTDREKSKDLEKMREKLGAGVKAKTGSVLWEETGFDNISVDEIHNFRNIFASARVYVSPSEKDEKKKLANEFQGLTGGQSDRAMKLFAITQLIQRKNNGRNVFGVSATPFNNSPIEVYNILSLVARDRLKEMGIYNMHEFLAQFAELKSEWGVKPNGEIEQKQVMKNWKNLEALQNLLSEYFDYVTADEAGVMRPKKITHENQLELSSLQKMIIAAETEYMTNATKEDKGATLIAINNMRMATLSPSLINPERFELYRKQPNWDRNKEPRKEDFVKASPKMTFVCDSVVKAWKEKPETGQIIYLPRGVNDFEHVRNYFVEKGMLKESVAFMHSGTSLDEKERIINDFNKVDGKIKVVIGSETIKEGVSLNGNTITTYNCMLGWNPTEATQVEGRAWRQGNKQGHVHMIYPLMADSIDSLMYQKYDEKATRINALWSYKGDTLDSGDIDPEELKFDLIKDPEKKARFKVGLEKEKIDNEIKIEQAKYDNLYKDRGRFKNATENRQFFEKTITELETELAVYRDSKKGAEKVLSEAVKSKDEREERNAKAVLDRVKWNIESCSSRLRLNKKSLKECKDIGETIKSKWDRMGVTNTNTDDKLSEITKGVAEKKDLIQKIVDKKDEYVREAKEQLEATKGKLPSLEQQIADNVRSIMGNLRSMDEVREEIKKERGLKKSFFMKNDTLLIA